MRLVEFSVSDPLDERELTALVARAREGGAAAFEALARRARELVHAWARRLTRDPDDAEDVAQLVLLRLHARIDQFEGRSRFTTWLYTVTRSVVLSRQARDRRRSALLAARRHEFRDRDEPDAAREHEHTAHVARLARTCFAVLTPREREVFELSELHGLTSAEVARRLGVKPVTVRVMLVKARRRIRLRMLEEHPELLEEYGR